MLRIVRHATRMKLRFSKKDVNANIFSIFRPGNLLKRASSTHQSQNIYLLDEDSSGADTEVNKICEYTNRSYTCGDLTIDKVGERVTLCGWLEYHRMNKFVVLRDSYGQTQLILNDKDAAAQALLENLPYESVIEVRGTVLARPLEMKNPKQYTGDIEVAVDSLKVLNEAKSNLPFNIREFQKAKESLRMQYRYLDLRFPLMQRNLRVRSRMLMKMREFLVNERAFVDVETPTLFKATPGGAQEFVVPTRFPGEFYSLVQSPQQFKQMLMAGAIDRYFQIARCYRDEGSRSDRQPEFTQLDIEMSFTNVESILKMVEDLLGYSWPKFLDPLPKSFPRMSFQDAMEQYGTDQPDVRFDFKLKNCTDLVKNHKKFANIENFGAYCLVFPKEYAVLKNKTKEKFDELAKQYPNARLVQRKVKNVEDFPLKIKNLLTEQIAKDIVKQVGIDNDDVLFLSYGEKDQVLSLLGKIRLEHADHLESLDVTVRKNGMHFLWVTDFPMFEGETSALQSTHHPFTAPNPEDVHLLDSAPLRVRALSYDLVLNGNEVGGGSVRIHNPKLQEKLLKMLRIDTSSMQHIIDMLASGCPPHGGIALGLDRLLSKILNTTSIRDVIAFPKTFEGRDPLSGAPSKISEADQKLYHIKSITNEASQ